MQSVTRRAEKAEAEARRRLYAPALDARGEGGTRDDAEPTRVTADTRDGVSGSEERESRSNTNAIWVKAIEPSEPTVRIQPSTTLPKRTNEDETARAFAAVEEHRRSMRAHLDALRRDREMLATTT